MGEAVLLGNGTVEPGSGSHGQEQANDTCCIEQHFIINIVISAQTAGHGPLPKIATTTGLALVVFARLLVLSTCHDAVHRQAL